MLVPQAISITQRTEKPCPLPNPNHEKDDINLRVVIRQEGGEGGGSEGGDVGGDAGGDVGGDVGGGVGGMGGGAGIGVDDGGYGGSGDGGSTSDSGDGSEIGTSSGGGSSPAVISGRGGRARFDIPHGKLFAGRTAGGGTRDQIFGDRLVQVDNYLPVLTLSCHAVNTEADIR